MHYYIDGYNLLFRVLHAGEDLQIQRQKIIDDLATKIKLLGLNVTLVFDSQYHHADSTRSHKQHLEILFTAQGEIADDLILDEIKRASKPDQITVVTSDKKLAWQVRRRAAKTETVEDFIQWLNKRYQNKLRHLKSKSQSVPIKESPSPPKKSDIKEKRRPSQQISPEKCMGYYQEVFEKKYQELSEHETPRKKPYQEIRKRKKTLAPPPPKNMTKEDEMERWLKIFDRKIKD